MTETSIEPTTKKSFSYHGLLLAGFAALATSLLVIGNISTMQSIELRKAEDLQSSLSQVIPASQHDNNLLDNHLTIHYKNNPVLIYRGSKKKQITAVAFSVSAQGYAGEISLIMGVSNKGEVLGVRVLSHAETPGLGDKIEKDKDDWIFSFNNLSLEKLPETHWKVKKDGGEFDQFSGATITPRAVVKAIKEGLILFRQHKAELLSIKPSIKEKNI